MSATDTDPRPRLINRPRGRPEPSRRHDRKLSALPSASLWIGMVFAAVLIVAETVLVRLLASVAPHAIFGVVFLFGVLVVSWGWDIRLAVMTTLVSTVVYLVVHLDADGGSLPTSPARLLPLAVFLPIALLANALAGWARCRALETRCAADQVSELARRQAALRRVATLIAHGVSPAEVFTAVAYEVANVFRADNCVLVRYSGDGACELVAAYDNVQVSKIPVGAVFPLDGNNIATMVLRTGTTARMDSHEGAAGPIAAAVRDAGIRSAVRRPSRSTADCGGPRSSPRPGRNP